MAGRGTHVMAAGAGTGRACAVPDGKGGFMMRQAVLAVSAAMLLGSGVLGRADDSGYFLSWQQKSDLMCLGRIQDSAGTWYDVWICPGYVPPARYAREHLKAAGGNFHEYVEANKYDSLREGTRACLEWAFRECGVGFTVKGIPRAWSRHFTVAQERTRRRVFGWWLAYPWAFMESTVETAFRGVVGSVGTAGGIVSGVAVVPAYHALDSAAVGVWNLGVNTIVVPAVGMAWNTVAGPPLALVGQKPAESRVDGFWVTVVDSGSAPVSRRLSQEEVRVLTRWGLVLLKETRPFAQKLEQIDAAAGETESRLRREMEQSRGEAAGKRVALQKEERAHVQSVLATNGVSPLPSKRPPARGYPQESEADIRSDLAAQGIDGKDTEKVLNLLRLYGASCSSAPSPVRSKTDPLQRGVEIIGESAQDVMK